MKSSFFICIDRCLLLLKASAVAHRSVKVPRLALLLGVALSTALLPKAVRAAHITLSGTTNSDDAVQLFDFTVATAGSVDLRSYG